MLAFNFHIGDFAKKTMHLTHEERGIYLSLLMRYYDTEAPLPPDTEAVARLVCARNADAMRVVCDVLSEFFTLHDDGWHNERADEEIQAYQSKREKARNSAKARWGGDKSSKGSEKKPKESDNKRNANAMRTHSEGNANHEPRTTNHITPNTSSSDDVNAAFEQFWIAGMRKVGKKAARKAFAAALKRERMAPDDFAAMLQADVFKRIQAGQMGFESMHPTTYLNGERWNDEISTGSFARERLSPSEQVERAIAEQNRQHRGCAVGMAEDDGNVWRPMDEGAGSGATFDLDTGAWET
ncbi:MAG: YdaU family protein [Pseudomonadota bacterium]